jgi:hypothetical protein
MYDLLIIDYVGIPAATNKCCHCEPIYSKVYLAHLEKRVPGARSETSQQYQSPSEFYKHKTKKHQIQAED